MASGSVPLYIYLALGLLFIDGAIEMGLVTTMVNYLHLQGYNSYQVEYPTGQTFDLRGKPENLLVNQGHTTNGAGGTIVVLLGFGGVVALTFENLSRRRSGKSSPIFYLWALFTFLSWLLTLVALIFTFVVTAQTDNQSIDLSVAAANAFPFAYPNDSWTPENWYDAVLDLPLTNSDDVDSINYYLRIMRGWRWNLIPMFVLGFLLTSLVIHDILRTRKSRGRYGVASTGEEVVESYRNDGVYGGVSQK